MSKFFMKETADLVLEREELLENDIKTGNIKVDKQIFDDFVPNTYINIQFVEDEDACIYQFSMVAEDNEGIFMEYLDCFNAKNFPKKMIEFCAGYYEWQVFADGELIHAFNDFSESITDDMTAETVAELVDDLIWNWQEDCRENGGYCPIDTEEERELATAMKTAICEHYGVN